MSTTNINLNNTHVYKRIFLQLKFMQKCQANGKKIKESTRNSIDLTRILLHVVLVHRVEQYLAKNNQSEPMSNHFSRKTANNSKASEPLEVVEITSEHDENLGNDESEPDIDDQEQDLEDVFIFSRNWCIGII